MGRYDLINHSYIDGCTEEEGTTAQPDCGHLDPPCGALCDVAMVAQRGVPEICAEYHAHREAEAANASPSPRLRGAAAGGNQVRELLATGLSLEDVARTLRIPLELAVDHIRWTRNTIDSPPSEAYLIAERLLRDGCESYGEVARQSGLTRHVVRGFAKAMGLTSKAKRSRRGGGGYKYTAVQYELVRELHANGLSYRQIEAETGIPYFTARNIVVRDGRAA